MGVCPTCRRQFGDEVARCPDDDTPLEPGAVARDARTSVGRGGGRAAPPARRAPAVAAAAAPLAAVALDAHEVAVGDVIGEYHVTGKLGEGGMGSVYAGVHPVIGKKVAIKVLSPALSHDREIVDRFVQEARAVNQISHRNIVDIFAFGQLPSGRHYCIMEQLDGTSLRARLSRTPPLTHPEVFRLLIDVCEALAAAHGEGIVHRDLKPDNIFLVDEKDGSFSTKLLDFGVAKLLRRPTDLERTRTGAPLGTPFYMSPEQCRNRAVDARTDIYAMGIIMFEVFTGRVPFDGSDYIDTVNGHLSQPPLTPSSLVRMSSKLEGLILRCLEKDPELRPQTAAALLGELREVAAEAGDEAVPVPPPSAPDTSGRAPRTSSTRAGRPSTLKRPRRPIGLVVAALVVAAAGGWATWRFSRKPAAAPLPATLTLEVRSEPPGARVTVDGRVQPQLTPLTVTMPAGAEIALRVDKDEYQPYDETLRPAAGETRLRRAVTLVSAPGGLFIATGEPRAHWLLDGAATGVASSVLHLEKVAPGVHLVRVEADGFLPFEQEVQVRAGHVTTLDWKLTPVAAPKRRPRPTSSLPDAPKSDFRTP